MSTILQSIRFCFVELTHPRAYGVFECTDDCTDITSASFLNTIGKKTDVPLRVSTVGPESGSADTVRDVHGWAMKLYTDQGNQDWVFNNTMSFSPVYLRCHGAVTDTAISLAAHILRPRPDQVSIHESIAQEAPENPQA